MPNPSYRIISLGSQLGMGVAGSQYASLSAVVKANVAAAPYCIPNEIICGELGRVLRLPVPPFGVVTTSGGSPMFASLDFNLAGNSLPPVDVARCVAELTSLATGVLLFDIWIANSDRHRQNISVDFLGTQPQLSVFDHSHALFGYSAGAGVARLTALQNRLGITKTMQNPVDSGVHRHCLLDAINIDDHFAFWFERIRAVPDYFIEEVCHEAQPFGLTPQENDEAIRFLKGRRDSLPGNINQHRSEFTAIRTWRLIP